MQTQQDLSNFIGRQTEIKIFKQWLANTASDAPTILYLYDALEPQEKKGGAGKTWLLRYYAMIAKRQDPGAIVVHIDFFDAASRDGVIIAERIVETLKSTFPQWDTTNFAETLKEYQETTSPEIQENTEQRMALAKALSLDLKKLDDHFAQTKTFLLVMFDTTELIEKTPSIGVLNFSQRFPDHYQFKYIKFVIASRNKIDWSQPNWLEREKEVREIPIQPFNQSEMVEYLLKESIYNPETQQEELEALYDRTEGRPILVGLVADVLNNHVTSVEKLAAVIPSQFESHLVSQIQQLENPVNWVILFMAHVYHRFNDKILQRILAQSGLKEAIQNISYQELMQRVPALSFVRTSAPGDNLVLHDEMRKLVNIYCWDRQDPERRMRKDISQCVIEYIKEEQENGQQLTEQERQAYTIELLFHTLFLDPAKGVKRFETYFVNALQLSRRPFARTLLQETLLFWNDMDEMQQNDLQLHEAQLLRVEENPTVALTIFQQFEEDTNAAWFQLHEAQIYWEKGQCYILQSKFSKAIESMQRSLDLERAAGNENQVGIILNKLGFVYRNQGQFDKAQSYYEQALDLYAKLSDQGEYANMINNLSNIYRLRGITQQALRSCKIGLNIRKSLFQAGKSGEYPIALSQSTMGLIYLDNGHFVWAGQRFQEAYEIHLRLGRKRELAQLYNRFAQIAMAKREYEEAESLLRRAEEASIETNIEAYTNSLNKQGRLCMLQKRWSEAIPLFEKASSKAREVHDDYQQTENLVDLAHALYRTNSSEAGEKILQEARNIAEQWNYYDLLGQAEEFLGDIKYDAHEFKAAFTHYQRFCRYMAIRSAVEYNKALSFIIDKLYEIPKEESVAIINDFIAYWAQENMEEKYPELEDTLRDISKAKFLEPLIDTNSLPLLDI
ncbi:hypothetical protein KDW_63110 [Dictyobacter vulcani]|uniref:Uncharacterized protein n=1 Tax=Dictyobacter vulcani TaxID=2607529 RepID=A0A5J4L1H9_9CHLR|nr:tetratricopeptide repeat protein [Dictyobacter vulcani]GER92149.1 hypothetical protein KDW_63110 [Dictyobacter vulcani]